MEQALFEFLKTTDAGEASIMFENSIVVKRCVSWADFKSQIEELAKIRKAMPKQDLMEELFGESLYRGHRDANWRLSTTLERTTSEQMKVSTYYLLLSAIHKHLITCGVRDVPQAITSFPEIQKAISDERPLPSLALLIFLRHLGFPSPLLDWTRSPYIAAFFAFQGCREEDNVAVYCFLEKQAKSTMSTRDNPNRIVEMGVIGEYVATHKRHFLQQSNYTLCLARDCENHAAQEFASYEAHLANNGEDFPEAIIIKFVVPGSEKTRALQELDKMNINAYSLFGSEEALVETLFNREILLKNTAK